MSSLSSLSSPQKFLWHALTLRDPVKNTDGEIIADISGGPREIFLAFTIACPPNPRVFAKTTNYSDVDRVMRKIHLPKIVQSLDEKSKTVLGDVRDNQPTTITEITARLNLSESTISRSVVKVVDLDALKIIPEGEKNADANDPHRRDLPSEGLRKSEKNNSILGTGAARAPLRNFPAEI